MINIFKKIFGIFSTQDIPDPKDRIKQNKIQIKKDKIIILQENVHWASIANTESMNPVIDKGHNALFIKAVKNDLQVGDIISYRKSEINILHRIIKISKDKKGWYAILKGDNNFFSDGKIRFQDIKYVVIGIIY
jgi:signal peptidase I